MVAFNATYFLCTSAYIENEGGKELLDHEIKKYQVTLDIGKGVVFEEANCKGRIYSSSTIDNTIQRACNAKNQNLGSEISNESLRSFIPTAKGKDKPALTETSAPFYLLSLADTVFKDQTHPTDRVIMNNECRLAAVVMETTRLSCEGKTCGAIPEFSNCKLKHARNST